jgi:hypothetical protein
MNIVAAPFGICQHHADLCDGGSLKNKMGCSQKVIQQVYIPLWIRGWPAIWGNFCRAASGMKGNMLITKQKSPKTNAKSIIVVSLCDVIAKYDIYPACEYDETCSIVLPQGSYGSNHRKKYKKCISVVERGE